MHEELRGLREVEIDHIVEQRNIQSSGGQVCDDQITHFTATKGPV
jgi:hypothetical protein